MIYLSNQYEVIVKQATTCQANPRKNIPALDIPSTEQMAIAFNCQ